jgi:hypothetical protein
VEQLLSVQSEQQQQQPEDGQQFRAKWPMTMTWFTDPFMVQSFDWMSGLLPSS